MTKEVPQAPATDEDVLKLDALRRHARRRKPVSVKIERDDDGKFAMDAPDADTVGWAARVNDAVGGASTAFGQTQLRHLSHVALANPATAQSATNSMLAAVEAVRPDNEVEGMLAVQMAATHQAAMASLGKAVQAGVPEVAEAMGNLANKLMRTYTMQVEALAKLRRGGEQTVRVEHVHVYDGGQAIVGSVLGAPAATWGDQKSGRQPHALVGTATLALPSGAAVLCEDAGRNGMPVAGREGEGSLPDARRQSRRRRPQG